MQTWAIVLILCFALLLLAAALTFTVYRLAKERKLPRKKKWWAAGLAAFSALIIASVVLTTVLIPPAIERKPRPEILAAELNSQAEKIIRTGLGAHLVAQGLPQNEIDEIVAELFKELTASDDYVETLAQTIEEIKADESLNKEIEEKAEKKRLSAVSKETNQILMKILSTHVAAVLMAFAVILMLLYGGKESTILKSQYFSSKNITCIAVFTAISSILYIIAKFPLPFIFPSFLDIQISDMPALLAGFMMGPQAGVTVIIVKTLIKLPFTGTNGVGELADVILGIAFVLPASIIYKYKRTKKGALIGLGAGCLTCVAAALLVNRFIVIPFYVFVMFEGDWNKLLGMVKPLYPDVTQQSFYKYYLWLAVLPFNLLRCVVSAAVTFFLYKSLSRTFNKIFTVRDKPLNEAPPV